jgi:hypothetical protein
MAAVVGRCYTAATRSIAAMPVVVAMAATSMRTPGTAVAEGHFRSLWAAGGRIEAMLVGVVAVLRCCTATDYPLAGD